jgi:hypothetical protein
LTPFGYLRDRLFLVCCGLYAANRLAVKPALPHGFFAQWFNDLLLMPCAVPVCLWLWRRTGLRTHDLPPTAAETAALLVLWSLLFEVAGPHLATRATGDWRDVIAYAAGALAAWLWWNRKHRHAPRL